MYVFPLIACLAVLLSRLDRTTYKQLSDLSYCTLTKNLGIFILEGLATILIATASYWMVHDFPDEATFLSADDRRRVIKRLKDDKQSSAEHEEFKMQYFWASLKDWKTYAFAIIYMG
jgi:hypothetical protein